MNEDHYTTEKYSVLSNIELSSNEQQEIWSNIKQQMDEAGLTKVRNHRSNVWGTSFAAIAAVAIVAGGLYAFSDHSLRSPQQNPSITVASNDNTQQPVIFFQNWSASGVKLTLYPDPLTQRIPNATPPSRKVIVYLPLYPGAASTEPVTNITDTGTPGDGDLVDGTLYFKSKDTQAQIQSWYEKQFQNVGYRVGISSQFNRYGKRISDAVGFSKNGVPGDPRTMPKVDLGFLAQTQNGETIFELKAFYILTPTRPGVSYLPNDIVKVVLSDGKTSKSMIDSGWIRNVVQMLNGLQMSTPSDKVGGPNITTVQTIHADFVRKSGSMVHVTFVLPYGNVSIAGASLADTPELEKTIQALFPPESK